MVSPCPPSTKALTSRMDTPNSSDRKWRKRALSSTPAMPQTLAWGRLENPRNAHTMASKGLVIQITKASGAWVRMPSATAFITFRLIARRSSRLIPGLRGTPAVTIHTSASAISLYSCVPFRRASNPATGPACAMSSALPWGTPSAISNNTTSPNSLRAARWARVPPI